MKLSILICTVENRREQFQELYFHLSTSPDILTTNKAYRIKFTIRDWESGTVTPVVNSGSVAPPFSFTGNGTFEYSYVAFSASGLGLNFSPYSCMTIDNVEVYEICRVTVAISETPGGTPVLTDSTFNNWAPTPFPNSIIYYLTNNILVDLNFASAGLPDGCYYIRVYCTDTPNDYIETKCLSVQTNPTCAIKLDWQNNEDIGGVLYSYVDYNQIMYVCGEFRNSSFNLPNELYEYSNGDTEILSSRRVTNTQLGIRESPEHIHRAIASGLILDTFNVNDVAHRFVGESYEPVWRRNSHLAPAFVELRPKLENYQNNLC